MPRARDRNGRHSRLPATPLPHRKVIILGLILALNNWSLGMIFPSNSFSSDLSLVESAYLGAAFSGGSIFGNILWGILADKYGRRIALLNGLAGTIIAAIFFGFSPVSAAVGLRFLWGLFNGNIGVSKTYMGEIMDDSNAARGMALYGVIGGMGRFIAPLVGSIAVLPAKQFAKFGVPLEEFPFAIPSAMVAVSCAGVLLFAYFELQETLKNRQKLDPTDKMKKNELYRQKKKTLRRGSAEYSAISGTDLDLDPEMDNESPREKEEREREKEDGVFGSRPVSLRNGAGGGAGGIFTSTASSNSAFRAVSSTPSSSSLSSASRINENLPGVVRPMTALKKSLCLPLPLPLTSRHPFDVTDRHSDDLLQMSAPSTARIEESFPSHFRMLSDQSTTNTNTNTSTSSSISTNDENSLVRAGFLGADSVLDNLVVGRSGVRVCDTGADTSSALSAHGNGSRDLNHGNRTGSLDIQRNDFIDWEREDTAGLGLGEELGVGVGVECVSLGVGKSSDGLGMINRNIDGRAGDKMKRSEWGTAKQGRSRLDSDSDIDFLSQSDSRRVSFSSLVMVKVIGSSSLGIGQLKHLRPDDHPVEQADRRESGVGQGPGSVPQSPSIDTADSPSSSSSSSSTRYSNGSEFNASLAARHGSLSQRVRYLLSKNSILVTTLMYGANGLLQLTAMEMMANLLVTPLEDGGFGYNKNLSGAAAAIATAATLTVLLQLSVYPTIADTYGVLNTYRLGCFLFALMLFLVPLITLFKQSTNTRAVWMLLTVSLTLTGTATMFTLISIYILINNSCYSHERATVNGIGQVFASIGRFCGPFLIYEIIANNGSKIPMDWLYNCFILGMISLLNSRLALLLPRSIERRKREPREPRYALSASSGDYLYEEHYAEMEDLLIPPEDTLPYTHPDDEEMDRDRERERERDREAVFTQTMSTPSNDPSMSSSSSLFRATPMSLSSSQSPVSAEV